MRQPIVLSGGAYVARDLIANAQRCVNLFPEINPQSSQSPVPVTHYQTPGLRRLLADGTLGRWRGLYRATDGQGFGVREDKVYYIAPDWSLTELGRIAAGTTPVSMKDDGLGNLVLVDGTINGYVIDLSTHDFTQISDPAFYGADRVDYLLTYMMFNRPGTNQFYTTLSNSISFDGLDIAAKSGGPDPISSLIVNQKEAWLTGRYTSEPWGASGSVDFPFAPVSSVLVEHGNEATHSLARADVNVFMLGQNDQGGRIAMMIEGYGAKAISTHALTHEWQQYARADDVIGFTYQQGLHTFYVMTFPSADVTYVYDLSTKQWHQWAWVDGNGKLRRHRANCYAYLYGEHVVGDHANGKLYALDPKVYTDDGQPIVRVRTFPHLINAGVRMSYPEFMVDTGGGNIEGHAQDDITVSDFNWDFNSDFGASPSTLKAPRIFLRWSDDRGHTWGNPVMQILGSSGQFNQFPTWGPCGEARDKVFEVSWAVNAKVSLNGAYLAPPVAANT